MPQPPGGGFDFVGRTLAEHLGKGLCQAVVVENRAVSGTLVGTDAAAQAAPDGYTLMGRKDLAVSSLTDLLAQAKSRPKAFSYASAGKGSGQHVIAAALWHQAGVALLHLP